MNPISNLNPITLPTPITAPNPAAASGQASLAVGAQGSATAGPAATATGFTQTLSNAIGSVSGLQTNADTSVAGLALNQGVDIHEAMIAMEQASLGMNLAVQVRNKAIEAYQTLINMQM